MKKFVEFWNKIKASFIAIVNAAIVVFVPATYQQLSVGIFNGVIVIIDAIVQFISSAKYEFVEKKKK